MNSIGKLFIDCPEPEKKDAFSVEKELSETLETYKNNFSEITQNEIELLITEIKLFIAFIGLFN